MHSSGVCDPTEGLGSGHLLSARVEGRGSAMELGSLIKMGMMEFWNSKARCQQVSDRGKVDLFTGSSRRAKWQLETLTQRLCW